MTHRANSLGDDEGHGNDRTHSVPAPSATVVPVLVYEDVGKPIDWLSATFGFRERR
jgi:hypothetical protein